MRDDRMVVARWMAVALMTASASAVAAENWVKLAPLANSGGTLYLDQNAVERSADGTVRATTRDAYDAPRKLSDGKVYQYDTRTSVYDCGKQRILPVSALIQDGQHATVLAKTIDGPRWEAVVPDTEGDAILRAVCKP